MCGICGILYFDGKRKPDEASLKRMNHTLFHRGPDDEGLVIRGQAGLAMRRLSIIDLCTGHQPLSNEDGTVWIVFNGEIYNYREVRSELKSLGHRFRTESDTEVILHGYETWGEEVCDALNGMFGFAIWDVRSRKLFMARDRLGVKPLYYAHDGEKLVFGSEIKALLQAPGLRRTIDPVALNQFITFEYIPAPRSIFREIQKLEPGHFLTWQDGRITTKAYWRLRAEVRDWAEEEASDRLAELMKDSVRLRLVSDVPLGAFLSGGIDSSIVVSQMAGLSDRPVRTFSIGFKESSYNELHYARAVARKYGTEHHELMIEPDALELTETLARHLDEPFGDFSIFPTYLVSRMAREHVTVCLSGDGGDELFAGYDTYLAHRFDRRFYHRLPRLLKNRIVAPIVQSLPPTEKKKGFINSARRFVEGTLLPRELLHARWMVFLTEKERESLLVPDVLEAAGEENPYDFILRQGRRVEGLDDVLRTGFIDVHTYLADDILVKVDRMSMAVSLEARVPYLDYRLVEFAFTLPPRFKLEGLRTKVILKDTFRDFLPPEVRGRGKQGFSIPIKNWLRRELKPMMTDFLDEGRLAQQGIFNAGAVAAMVKEHLEGKRNHSHTLWALMMFQQWFDLYASRA